MQIVQNRIASWKSEDKASKLNINALQYHYTHTNTQHTFLLLSPILMTNTALFCYLLHKTQVISLTVTAHNIEIIIAVSLT